MERHYNKRTHQVHYKIGDHVWVKDTRRYKGLSPKLTPKWRGPYVIVGIISDWLIKIRTHRGQQVVHHNRVKAWEGANPGSQMDGGLDESQDLEEQSQEQEQSEPEDSHTPEETRGQVTRTGRQVHRPAHLADFFNY